MTDEYKDMDTVQTMQGYSNSLVLLLETRDCTTNQKYTIGPKTPRSSTKKNRDFRKEWKGLEDALHCTVNNIFKPTFKWYLFKR